LIFQKGRKYLLYILKIKLIMGFISFLKSLFTKVESSEKVVVEEVVSKKETPKKAAPKRTKTADSEAKPKRVYRPRAKKANPSQEGDSVTETAKPKRKSTRKPK
jgi:hypothetical protein